jgi:murein DD-endopeptidase MepM/ murein hydrolase activator NlpD
MRPHRLGELIRTSFGFSRVLLGGALLLAIGASPAMANGRVKPSVASLALSESGDSVHADKRGFGDEQFNRFIAPASTQATSVPSLAAIYEASAPAKPRAFGEGALPLAEAAPKLGAIPTDTASALLGLSGGVAPAGMPLSHARLTSEFGMRYHPILGGMRNHTGVDLEQAVAAKLAKNARKHPARHPAPPPDAAQGFE